MIPAKRKVGHDLFEGLMKQGRAHHSEHFSLRIIFGPSVAPAQFSVVVAKKIDPKAKSAVWRNSMKRRVYKILRPLLSKARPGSVGAFFLKKGVDTVLVTQLEVEIQTVLRKVAVI